MPSTALFEISPAQFCRLADKLARKEKADLFLSCDSYAGRGTGFLGWEPTNELIVTSRTTRNDIASFCFSDRRPTFGFLSYDYGRLLRGMAVEKGTAFPLGHLKKYAHLASYDGSRLSSCEPYGILPDAIGLASETTSTLFDSSGPNDTPIINQSTSRDQYIDRVQRVIDYIREGYVYQLNLSIKYSVHLNDPDIVGLFLSLWSRFPAPYYALFSSNGRNLISTSPERFLHVRDGDVISQPIKGTLAFDQYDPALADRLINSPKEAAELSMIVDMVRNDISYNCRYGSIEVRDHKSTFVVDHLIQMYSSVLGKLREDRSTVDLLLDAFPGASVTGCPKKKAMDLIDELEPHSRDIYCGAFFIIFDEKNMESSIAIRTGYLESACQRFNFYAGSGIVVDSVPADEYHETVAKAQKFLTLFAKGV